MKHNYETLLNDVLTRGDLRGDRTGTGTLSLFAPPPLTYSLRNFKVPLIQSKRVAAGMATAELLWMLHGSSRVDDLRAMSPRMADIWSSWADEHGSVGPTYGRQWRSAGGSLTNGGWGANSHYGVDQLRKLVVQLAEQPYTRRAVVSLWSVPELDDMGIEPCMVLFQFSLRGDKYEDLELHVYQRSADMMLGVPFDLYQAGLLAHLVARELWLTTGRHITATKLTWSAGDVHVYLNQLDAARAQLQQWREAGHPGTAGQVGISPSPAVRLLDNTLQPEHIELFNYTPLPAIDAGAPAV